MPRPRKCRLVGLAPEATVFKPCGIPACASEAVKLGLDELEAIRLADLDGLYQQTAAEKMRVSRATFGRLIEAARHKIATALLQSRTLAFQGGPVQIRRAHGSPCVHCMMSCQARYARKRGKGHRAAAGTRRRPARCQQRRALRADRPHPGKR